MKTFHIEAEEGQIAKTVDPDATIVQEAKLLGICFGD